MTLADLYSLGVVHWLTDGMTNITLSCLPNRLAHCVWNFFRSRLIHRLADRVALLTGLVHRLADRIFHVPKALLLFIANAVDFLLLYNFFADGFVAGVLLLLVDNILDKPRTTT